MRMKISSGLALVVVAAIVLSCSGVYAGGSECSVKQNFAKKDSHFKKMCEDLKLTPEQAEQLTKNREEFASKSKDLKEKIRASWTALNEELEKPAPDMAKVNSLSAEIKNVVGQQVQSKIDKIMATKQILTPEQYSKMKDSAKDRKHKKYDKDCKCCGKSASLCTM